MSFKGKTALITGASVGIGRATAREFAKRNADVVLLDMDMIMFLIMMRTCEI